MLKNFDELIQFLSILPISLAKKSRSFSCLLINKADSIDRKVCYAEKCTESG